MFNKFNKKEDFIKEKFNINEKIHANYVILINSDGTNLGKISIEKARKIAYDLELDLVELSCNNNNSVCKVMDYKKFKYENSIKEKLEKKKQKENLVELKQLRITPNIGDNDLNLKIEQAIKFLNLNNSVQFICKFKNRQKAHKDIGNVLYNKIMEQLKDYGSSNTQPQISTDSFIFTLDSKLKANK